MRDLFSQEPAAPLAEALRPKTLDEVIGQSHLLGEGKPLRLAFKSGKPHSMIFWGPPGVGKTTLARLTATAIEPRTPLELRIQQFGRYLVGASVLLFALVIALGLGRGMPFGEILMIAISQMVSMVPEGLPVAMTIALSEVVTGLTFSYSGGLPMVTIRIEPDAEVQGAILQAAAAFEAVRIETRPVATIERVEVRAVLGALLAWASRISLMMRRWQTSSRLPASLWSPFRCPPSWVSG